MASTIPNQERVVDPFASYNSNVVNRITEIVTHNNVGMLTISSMEVVQDSTSPNTSVVVKPGYAVKDDVLIKITAEHTVDFTDPDQWVTPPDITFPGGNCYVVLEYQYLKQRPAPQANIKILQPNERPLINGDSIYLLLKVVETSTISPHDIVALYDYDPEVGFEDNARKYIKYYAGGEVNLPTFEKTRDQGRVAYESERNKFFFGYSDAWGELTAGGVSVDLDTDSTGVVVGQLCYIDGSRKAQPAISTDLNTSADVVVTAIGTAASGIGRGSISGFAEGVPVETGVVAGTGDILYLSATEAGTVTNVRPGTFYQVVGRALSAGSGTTPLNMIFSPKLMLSLSSSGTFSTYSGPDATGYYHDIDVSALDGTSAFDCHWFDDATNREIRPTEVEIRNGGDVIRVYFDVDTLTVNYIIQSSASAGGAGGGGGGGSSDHSLLLNLDYASSGHTGFAPDPHGNGSHSQTYITAAGVTYENLSANGDIGSGSTQVPQGSHTHEFGDLHNYNDIPSGQIILFESDVAVTGYTLLTTQDDMVVYITKGSAAGGVAGGTLRGTWTQPSHTHGIDSEGNHQHSTPANTHNHKWYDFQSKGNTYSWASNGSTQIKIDGDTSGSTTQGLMGEVTSADAKNPDTDFWTQDTTIAASVTGSNGAHDHGGNTQAGSTVNTWRPRGRTMTRQQRI